MNIHPLAEIYICINSLERNSEEYYKRWNSDVVQEGMFEIPYEIAVNFKVGENFALTPIEGSQPPNWFTSNHFQYSIFEGYEFEIYHIKRVFGRDDINTFTLQIFCAYIANYS